MKGDSQQRDETSRRGQPRVALLLWLLTALSVLQWTPPAVDPGLFARLTGGAPLEAGLADAERLSPAIETGTSTTIASEKRSAGSRSLPSAEDGAATVDGISPPTAPRRAAIAASVPASGPRTLAGHSFTARSPPHVG